MEQPDGTFKKAIQEAKGEQSKRLSKALQQAVPNSTFLSKDKPLQSGTMHGNLLNPQKKEPIANKKIRGAIKSIQDGVKFDSNLEKTMYNLLNLHKIEFEFKKMYCIQEGFMYNGKKIRSITWTPDFCFPILNIVADTKGFATTSANIKIKMFKFCQWQNNQTPQVVLLKDKKECEQFINKLLSLKLTHLKVI